MIDGFPPLFGDEIEEIETVGCRLNNTHWALKMAIFPAKLYGAPKDMNYETIMAAEIQDEMMLQVEYFNRSGNIDRRSV